MTAPVIRQFVGSIPDKGQAQTSFDTNVDAWLDWTTLQFAPDLVDFGTWADGVQASLIAGNLPPLTGRALDAVRVNAAANGVEFANVTAAGWAVLDDVNAAAQRVTLGAAPLGSPTFTGTATAPMARLTSTGNIGLSSTNHAFQIGPSNAVNLRIDNNEIMSLTNGVGSFLGLNKGGGNISIGKPDGLQIVDIHGQFSINGSEFTTPGTAPLFACRAWVNFNGSGTVAIRASGNVSSITDNGTGDYTVNFATAMEDADYSAMLARGNNGSFGIHSHTLAAGSLRLQTKNTSSGSIGDASDVSVAIFR